MDTTPPMAALTSPPPTINVANGGNTTTLTVTYADSGSGINTATFSTSNLLVTNGATVATVTAVSASGNLRPAGQAKASWTTLVDLALQAGDKTSSVSSFVSSC
jgi:hypothetical protein